MNDKGKVHELWEAAARCLPALSSAEQRAGLVLLRELARGEPIAIARLARVLGTPLETTKTLMRDSALAPYVHAGEGDQIQGFMGLAVTPTSHQLMVNGITLWTWCAYDTLFLPELLGKTAEVETRDPETGEICHLTVSPNHIEAAQPAGIVASIVGPQMWDHGSSAKLRGSACKFMYFFTSRASGERWHANHPDTVLLPLDGAFAFGKRSNAHRFGAELARRRADTA